MPNYFLTSADNGLSLTLGGISGSPDIWASANGLTLLTTSGSANSMTLMGHSTLTFTNSSITNNVGGHGVVSFGNLTATINAGSSISAGHTGVTTYPNMTLKLTNAGIIEGAEYGVSANYATIYNSGTIKTTSSGSEAAIWVTGDAAIQNTGTIAARHDYGVAIKLGGFSNRLDNYGTIIGTVGMGFDADNNAIVARNTINNYGTMGMVATADGDDTVTNAGYMFYVYMGDGADSYIGMSNAFALVFAGDGDDQMLTLSGNEYLNGEAGNDAYTVGSLANAHEMVSESIGSGNDTIKSNITRDLAAFANFENIVLEGSRGANAIGNGVANVLGGDENSTANLLRGNAGNDTYRVDLKDIVDEQTGGSGTDTVVVVQAGAFNYSLSDTTKIKGAVENLSVDSGGSPASGTLTGNALGNVITVLQTTGKTVKMTLKGLAGNDIYVVDNLQIVDESAAGSNGVDRVRVKETYSLSDTAKVKGLVEQIEWIGATTSATTATLTGNGLGNTLISASIAKITLRGLAGNDVYTVGANAIVDESATGSNGTDTILSAFSVDLGNTAKVKGTVENVTLTGTAAVNAIAANNTVANKLTGNIKANILDGKGGADKFVFNTAYGSGNVDTVKGFTHALDEIQLDDAIFKGLGTAVEAAEFRKGAGITTAANADQHLIYNTTNGALYWDFDGNKAGGVAAVQIAILTDKPALDHTDFAIV